MGFIVSFIALFIIAALILSVTGKDEVRGALVKVFSVLILAGAAALAVLFFISKKGTLSFGFRILDYVMMGLAVLMAVIILCIGVKNRKFLLTVITLVQTVALGAFIFRKGMDIPADISFTADRLSLIIIVLTAVSGAIISIYSVGYMRRYHERNPEIKDRRSRFFGWMFLSFGAMAGLALSNNVIGMYFFWEVIALAVYAMTGYGRSDDARRSAFRQLTAGMFAGLLFVAGITILGTVFGTVEMDKMILIGSVYEDIMAIPAVFAAFGGIVMAAQIPFSGWLAAAPVRNVAALASASCATGLTAGVYILIKMTPLLGMNNFAGISVMIIGGVSFTAAAFIAIGQSDVWKLSSYSTVAVMGLITACAGLGTAETLWTAVMLLIFHCFTKLTVLICTGNAEDDVNGEMEDRVDAYYRGKPDISRGLVTGVSAFFISLLGMFVFRDATLSVFASSGNILLLALICFGSFALILYLVKWIGRFLFMTVESIDDMKNDQKGIKRMGVLLTVLCLLMPVISMFAVTPYMSDVFGGRASLLNVSDIVIAVVMAVFLILMNRVLSGKTKLQIPESRAYVRGIRAVDQNSIMRLFDERKILTAAGVCVVIMMIVGAGFMIGTLTSLLGGAV